MQSRRNWDAQQNRSFISQSMWSNAWNVISKTRVHNCTVRQQTTSTPFCSPNLIQHAEWNHPCTLLSNMYRNPLGCLWFMPPANYIAVSQRAGVSGRGGGGKESWKGSGGNEGRSCATKSLWATVRCLWGGDTMGRMEIKRALILKIQRTVLQN